MYVEHFFTLSSQTKELLQNTPYQFGFGLLGEVTFYRSYSRIKEDGTNEHWPDTVIRVTEGIFSIRKNHALNYHLPWNENEAQEFAKYFALSMLQFKWLPPGRGLWMMGTRYMYERGSAGLYNCAAVDTADLAHAADWAMDMLMVGAGVGFNTAWSGKATRPDKTHPKMYVIDDSKEGWVKSVRLLIQSYTDNAPFYRFDYSKIRPAGSPLKTFGGVAPGPEPLKRLHKNIEKILDDYVDKKIDKTRCVVDLFNNIGLCVVSGNIRRSAEIAIGKPEDETFLYLKDYEKFPDRKEFGWISNNSVVIENLDDFHFIDAITPLIATNGEPGLLHLENMQKFGRFGEIVPDKAWLSNPCGEIALEGYELCNLSEIFVSKCKNEKEFLQLIEYATFYASTVNLLPTHRAETNEIIARNRRIGVSVSGVADAIEKFGLETLIKWLRKGYKKVRAVNERLAKEAGIPVSLKVTCVKPSGTISILAGTSPGMHYPLATYALRRIRIGKTSKLAKLLIESGLSYEEDLYDTNSYVFSFPIRYENPRSIKEVEIYEQMLVLSMLQREWADNMVSNTIQFDPSRYNAKDLSQIIKYFLPMIKSLTLLPKEETVYPQMPFESISEMEYKEKVSQLPTIKWNQLSGHHADSERFCSARSCEINQSPPILSS
ncbi:MULTISPECIES: fused protease/ribonucleoside-triphosphate reductase [unclassified Nitratiruptor]|uniref:fused protease/ribonucleoside-triphosphate reductase n=1 Tax=unclassified Nitratiruptor TaxID=2624044 RepID=UPI0019163A54|nr:MULTISPECIES: fused protease/ribonucleoside-triphosphate reductase [unclassified Nitratiruptor]BCD60466.1 ribonucleoside-diphosphate reductase alpha chain [Nitratiruptor sp. YY08-10]BCD64045.1 ribonucleoside-diphosphate reductase alpha chain [Nitratiruptor sp. YY08-14]